MSENTTPAKCTEAEWTTARDAGLLISTTQEEVALHKFAEAIRDEARATVPNPATQAGALQAVEKVYLVATGETHDGQETYTRHDARPPLCDAETLYTAPLAATQPNAPAESERERSCAQGCNGCDDCTDYDDDVTNTVPVAEVVAWESATERYLADIIDRAPEPLRRLGEWLSRHLDEDDWKTAERYVLGAMESHAAAGSALVHRVAPTVVAHTGNVAGTVALSAARRNVEVGPSVWYDTHPRPGESTKTGGGS